MRSSRRCGSAPAVKVGGRIFLALRRGTLIARLGAEEVDARVLAGDGVRFDPSGKGRAMKDWLESSAEHAEWVELGLAALAFTAGGASSVDQPRSMRMIASRHITSAEGDDEARGARGRPSTRPKTASRTSWTQW